MPISTNLGLCFESDILLHQQIVPTSMNNEAKTNHNTSEKSLANHLECFCYHTSAQQSGAGNIRWAWYTDLYSEEINMHTACIITDGVYNNEVYLSHLPAVRLNCHKNDFISQVQHGVTIGCAFFIVYEGCALSFLDNFHDIHDWVDQKYEKKVLVVTDTQNVMKTQNVMEFLQHRIVLNDIPLTVVLQPDGSNDFINIWSAYPFDSYFHNYNRLFLSNHSLLHDKEMIPKIIDLNGLIVTGAFMNYPPYASYNRVIPGTGNVELFDSNESLPIHLDGQEHIILLEFCIVYNCTLKARLEYDEELWGEVFENRTGHGLLGALTMRKANVSVAAMYLWCPPYRFTQYSSTIQRAIATHIVPKPLQIPFWKTPFLPLPPYIWLCVISTFLIGALVWFAVSASQNLIRRHIVKRQKTHGLLDTMLTVFKMSLFQSARIKINIDSISNVTIITSILTFALVIGSLYSGGLSYVMTITHYENPIDTLESLIKSKFLWGGTSMEAIKNSDDPTHKTIIKGYVVKPIPELRVLVQQQKIAISVEMLQHGTLSYQSYLDKESSKHYMLMPHPIYWEHTIVMSSKTWPFMEQLNRIIFMQQESGIRYYWEHSAASRTVDYDIQHNLEINGKRSQETEPVKLSVQHILGIVCYFTTLTASEVQVLFCVISWCYNIKSKGITK
ncbi:hypothetical protein Bhyg_09965 [Pseudolycoriella hygida]|uniref:Ionotropic glutamate receptor C-terminal domain-containing protein n=1 Tax=Pseudolycoriella hygida TaxID=35572 RepID=A0A9Q0MUB8_9DIPT|nr:hypothetical protein Bhyg_09965 [Pseudolycoriella hygida]